MNRHLILLLTFCCLLMTACSTSAPENTPVGEAPAPESLPAEDTSPAEFDWGVTLTVENVTPSGLTIRCLQSGGAPTGELSTGSFYSLEQHTGTGWEPLEYLPQEYDIAWTSEAWMIPLNQEGSWDVNWGWLYGALPAGTYRIGKNVMDWRAPGEYDQQMFYAEFEIA